VRPLCGCAPACDLSVLTNQPSPFPELFAFRIGTAKLKAAGFGSYDAHDHAGGASHAAHGPEVRRETPPATPSPDTDIEIASDPALDEKHDHALSHEYENMESGEIIAQLMGVAVLEFGVVCVLLPPLFARLAS
jgi:hypothetical protein